MMNNFYDGNMFGWGLGGGIMMLIFWAVIILLIVWIVKAVGANGKGKTHSKSSGEHLKERYAKGEITKEQFESMKKDIGY
jgi:putative membrane protein